MGKVNNDTALADSNRKNSVKNGSPAGTRHSDNGVCEVDMRGESNHLKKLIYLRSKWINGSPGCCWIVVSAHRKCSLELSVYDQVENRMSPYPSLLSNLTLFANAIYKSKIFYIGGQFYNRYDARRFVDTVVSFDTNSRSWDTNLSTMNSARAYHTAVVVKNKIYVFGCSSVQKLLPREQWGESLCVETDTWTYLPQPPEELFRVYQVRTHAVYHKTEANKHNLIIFPLPSNGLCFFNCDTNLWESIITPLPTSIHQTPIFPKSDSYWSERVTVIDDVLLWHYCGTIYGYNLITREFLSPLCRLDNTQLKKDFSFPTFLVYTGDGRLCLVHPDNCDPNKIHCHKFLVEKPLRLALEVYSVIYNTYEGWFDLEDVLPL